MDYKDIEISVSISMISTTKLISLQHTTFVYLAKRRISKTCFLGMFLAKLCGENTEGIETYLRCISVKNAHTCMNALGIRLVLCVNWI